MELWTPPREQDSSADYLLNANAGLLDIMYYYQLRLDEIANPAKKRIYGNEMAVVLDRLTPKGVAIDAQADFAKIALPDESGEFVNEHEVGIAGTISDVAIAVPPEESRVYSEEEGLFHYKFMLEVELQQLYYLNGEDRSEAWHGRGYIPIIAAKVIALSAR